MVRCCDVGVRAPSQLTPPQAPSKQVFKTDLTEIFGINHPVMLAGACACFCSAETMF